MNRHQLVSCVGIELQKALKVYTHDDLSRQVTDTAAVDVLSALRESLKITALHQLDALPTGAVIRAVDGIVYEKSTDGQWNWYAPGNARAYPAHLRACMLDAMLLWHPGWSVK